MHHILTTTASRTIKELSFTRRVLRYETNSSQTSQSSPSIINRIFSGWSSDVELRRGKNLLLEDLMSSSRWNCLTTNMSRFEQSRHNDKMTKTLIVMQDIVHQLKRLMSNLTEFHTDCHKVMTTLTTVRTDIATTTTSSVQYLCSFQLFHGVKLFPIDLDLARTAFQYQSTNPVTQVVLSTL